MRRKSNVWYPLERKLLAYSIMGKILIQGNFDARYAAPAREANQSDKGAGVQCASFVVMQCVLELVCQ
eukprot:scaffold9069_cov134-Skeletonema_marinoi.AAC.6